MLEYFSYKKIKKHRAEKERREQEEAAKAESKGETNAGSSTTPAAATPPTKTATLPRASHDKGKHKATETPVLDAEDESFFARLTSGNASLVDLDDAEGDRPPLPPRIKTPDLSWDSDSESFIRDGAGSKSADSNPMPKDASKSKKKESAAANLGRRISVLVRRPTRSKSPKPSNLAVPEPEAAKEQDDLSRVLEDLSLSAKGSKAFSMSPEISELVSRFTLILKDLVNGVPTAAGDLKNLLDDRDGTLAKGFDKLPGSMKKLVAQLPEKVTGVLGPEVAAAAAKSQGKEAPEGEGSEGLKATAKMLLLPKNLTDLVTKPGAIVGMLKAIMNALKLRWPAFIGTNVILSVALFLLMFVLWYCHKRGREVRLAAEGKPVEAGDRVEELPDDPALEGPARSSSRRSRSREEPLAVEASPELPHPHVGPGASERSK